MRLPEPPDLDLGALRLRTITLDTDHPRDPELAPEAHLELVALAGATDRLELRGAHLGRVRIGPLRAAGVALRATRLSEVEIQTLDTPSLAGPYGEWSDTTVDGGRLGVAELYEVEWHRVRLTGVRARYLNLRGARLSDVELRDCVIDELDLGGAALTRAALPGTSVGRLELTDVSLTDVDLRGSAIAEVVGMRHLSGAVIDEVQLAELAPVLAAQLGIRVVPR